MIFGDGVGASLVRGPYCQLDVVCVTLLCFYIGTAQLKKVHGGLKPDLQGGTGFNLLRVHFWTPMQRKRVFKRGSESGPLEIKSGSPLEGPVWYLLAPQCGKSVDAFISSRS